MGAVTVTLIVENLGGKNSDYLTPEEKKPLEYIVLKKLMVSGVSFCAHCLPEWLSDLPLNTFSLFFH